MRHKHHILKSDKFYYIEIKNLCSSEDSTKAVERHVTNGEKYEEGLPL